MISEKSSDEFPALDQLSNTKKFKERTSIKLASKGTKDLSPAARNLINYLNSDLFLRYLQKLTGISTLISDPYLFGGGYHEIKKGGYLKVHADYNKHDYFLSILDRRVNLLLYLNDDWKRMCSNLGYISKDNLTSPNKFLLYSIVV